MALEILIMYAALDRGKDSSTPEWKSGNTNEEV